MKGIIIMTLFMLAGCSGYQTLEQLEAEAMISGDWSAVEKREDLIARYAQRNGPYCPDGLTAFCETYTGGKRCTCVDSNQTRALLHRY